MSLRSVGPLECEVLNLHLDVDLAEAAEAELIQPQRFELYMTGQDAGRYLELENNLGETVNHC